MTMTPNIQIEDNRWTAWYDSGTCWVEIDGKFEPTYQIHVAYSDGGLTWRQTGHRCIPKLHELEANTRPSVLRTADGDEMWFSYRNSQDYGGGAGSYRIGYATSSDGRDWTRYADPDGLAPTCQGRNSATMSYPSVIVVDGRKLMFHNGDDFGTLGIGCAVLEDA